MLPCSLILCACDFLRYELKIKKHISFLCTEIWFYLEAQCIQLHPKYTFTLNYVTPSDITAMQHQHQAWFTVGTIIKRHMTY